MKTGNYLERWRENVLQFEHVLPIPSESDPRTNDPNKTPAMKELIVAGLNQDLKMFTTGLLLNLKCCII